MPRGVRGSINYDAQIRKLDERIEKHTQSILSLKTQRQDLLSKKQEAEMRDLYAYMQEHGMSASDVLSQLPDSVAASTDRNAEHV